MTDYNTLTVYLGSSGRCRPVFKDCAREMGRLIGEHNKTLVYGGMDAGLMGIVANNALEYGARVTGIIPKNLQDSQRIHPNLSQTILVPDLWERKLKMFRRADVIVGLPGGFGTIDEVLEALYWGQLGSHAKPVVLVNIENYWDDFITYIRAAPDLSAEHLIIADSPQDVFVQLNTWHAPKISGDPANLPHFEGDILQEGTDTPIILQEASIKLSYLLATALGLKQLGKHSRPIGLLNDQDQFESLLRWIDTALEEHFITDRCPLLFSTASTENALCEKLSAQTQITIDLDREKWGPSETKSHIEIHEEE